MSKRKCDDIGSNKKSPCKGFLGDKYFYLHPAALSKARKSIFETKIKENGGYVVESLDSMNVGPAFALVEDQMIDGGKLDAICNRLVESKHRDCKDFKVLGYTWLSSCLEKKVFVDPESCHRFYDSSKLIKNADTADPDPPDTCNTDNQAPISYAEKNRHKFVCAQSSTSAQSTANLNPNKDITDELEKLAKAYKSSNDTWRAFGYQKAIAALKSYPKKITSRDEASNIPNVGKKMADKIMEIIEEGSLQKVKEVCDSDKVTVISLFNRVWGVGPTTAEKWYNQGLRTLEDLAESGNLTKQQEIGLKHFKDLDERMPRDECTRIYEIVKKAACELVQDGLEVVACGSYRRGKPTCGDLDILITHENDASLEGLFENLLNGLRASKFLTDDLSVHRDGRQKKYLGVCRLPEEGSKHRRLDIIVVPPEERAPALMYFTGSAHFNRSMRLLASRLGMSLSEHSLVTDVVREKREKLNEGNILPTPTEESIFKYLGLEFRPPHERDH